MVSLEKLGLSHLFFVLISLINSFCVPILLYGMEFFHFSLSMYNTLESAFSNAFYKIFNSSDKMSFFCHILSLSDTIDIRRMNYLQGMIKSDNVF